MLEQLSKQKLLERVKTLFEEAVSSDSEWQKNAKESFEFRDGIQWTDEEKTYLKSQKRPALTFNITKAHTDLIMGLNENQRKRFICVPVSKKYGFLCEILNNIIYWLYEANDWFDEEDHAFHSSIISGRGWIGIDFDIDPNSRDQILITESNIPIFEVRRDPASRRDDLEDASYIIWDKWLSVEDFIIKYPKLKSKVRQAFAAGQWPSTTLLDHSYDSDANWLSDDLNDESDYEDELNVNFYNTKKRQLRVVHMEYWKNVEKYWVKHPETGKYFCVEEDWNDFKDQYAKSFPEADFIYEKRMQKEVWWMQFSGDEILYNAKSPLNYDGFSVVPCFLYKDISSRHPYHFGIVELIKDAQREVNKRWSQSLNFLNKQVQPGLFAEVGAFLNKDGAQESLYETGGIAWLNDGAIQQKKIQERKLPSFPSAVMQMEQFAQEIVRRITNISPDLLGQNDQRTEPGIVVQLRQQQGMVTLKPVFKAYDVMRKELFKRQVSIITQYMPMEQVAKILGETERYNISPDGTIEDTQTGQVCNVKDFRNIEYSIDAEPVQANMTQDMMELATYTEMQKNGFPVDPKVIISKTNLPASEKIEWLNYLDAQQEGQTKAAEEEFELKRMEIEGKQNLELKKIQMEAMIAAQKIENQREKDFLKSSADQSKLDYTKERDFANLKLKFMELMMQVQAGNSDRAVDIAELLLSTDGAIKDRLYRFVETMIKAKVDSSIQSKKSLSDIITNFVSATKDIKVAKLKDMKGEKSSGEENTRGSKTRKQ